MTALIRKAHNYTTLSAMIDGLSQNEKTAWFVVFVLEGIAIIICNIISLIVFSRKARHSKPCLLLMNQSLADLLVGLEAIYYSLNFVYFPEVDSTTDKKCASTVHLVKTISWNFVVYLSLNSLTVIALDRAFSVFKPFRHRVLKSKHYYYGILGTWAFSCIPSLVIVSLKCEGAEIMLLFLSSLLNAAILGTVLILVVAYASVYIKVKYFPVFPSNLNYSHTRSQIKLSITLFFASAASMATILPPFGIQMYLGFHSDFRYSEHLSQTAVFLVIANSFINFFIYAWRFPEFVKDMKRFFCCTRTVVIHGLSHEMSRQHGQGN